MIEEIYYINMNINKIINSLLSPFTTVEFYKKSINKSVLSSFSLMMLVLLITAIISGLNFVNRYLPGLQSDFTQVVNEINTKYPQELIFKWDGSSLNSNAESFAMPWPSNSFFESEVLPNQFAYYSNSENSPSDLEIKTSEYLMFVNNKDLYRMEGQTSDQWVAQPIKDLFGQGESFTITKDIVSEFSEFTLEFIGNNQSLIKGVALSLFVVSSISGQTWFFIFETLLVVLLFKLYAIKLTIKQNIVLTMHVMIPTAILNTLANLIYKDIPFPFETITFWILIIFLSFYFKKMEMKK